MNSMLIGLRRQVDRINEIDQIAYGWQVPQAKFSFWTNNTELHHVLSIFIRNNLGSKLILYIIAAFLFRTNICANQLFVHNLNLRNIVWKHKNTEGWAKLNARDSSFNSKAPQKLVRAKISPNKVPPQFHSPLFEHQWKKVAYLDLQPNISSSGLSDLQLRPADGGRPDGTAEWTIFGHVRWWLLDLDMCYPMLRYVFDILEGWSQNCICHLGDVENDGWIDAEISIRLSV